MRIFKWLFNFFKKIILFVIKEIASFFIKMFLFLIIILGIANAFIEKKENENRTVLKENFYVSIDLSQKFKEKDTAKNFFDEKPLNFYSLIENIYDITENDRVKGLILKLDNISLDSAQMEEFMEEIALLSSIEDMEVIAYIENVNRKSMYLASIADKIYMPKTHSTIVNIYPYFKESFYKKNLLDKLGVKFNIVNTGDYKSYGEDLAHSEMSKETREDTTRILEENYQNFLDTVSKNYKYDRNTLDNLIKNGDLVAASSEDLLKNKLITGYMYWDELRRTIGENNIVDINDYARDYFSPKITGSKNKIYIMALEGEIVHTDEEIFDNMFISSKSVIDNLNKLEKDDTVKGLVIRINSPGGSALTSDKINNRIKEFKKKKPVYISMGGVAASGGYYISANANKIFADKNTITGSIGVVSIMPNFSELLEKAGVNNQKISEGKFADLYSSDKMTEEKYNKILNSNLKVYDDFLNEVSKGRKIEREKLEKIAEGRIWTGKEAVQLGLVDEIGSMSHTIYTMIEDLGISNDFEIVFLEEKFDVKNLYRKYSRFLKADKLELLKNNIYDENLYNKPVLYFPYEILD